MKNIINYILIGIVLVCVTWIISKEVHTSQLPQYRPYVLVDTSSKVVQTMQPPNTAPVSKSFGWDTIIAALLGSGGIGYLLIKYFLYDRKDKIEEQANMKTVLINHPIFSTIQEILIHDIKNIDFDSEGRTEIFRTMVSEQCSAYLEHIRRFVNEEKEFTSPGDFRNKIRLMIISCNNDYEKRWIDLRVPSVVIEKYKEWHAGRLEVLLNEIDTIALYKHSNTYDQAIYEVLLSVSSLLRFGITNDSIRSLGELNGELTGLKFHGKTV